METNGLPNGLSNGLSDGWSEYPSSDEEDGHLTPLEDLVPEFEVIDEDIVLEEETISSFDPERWYPIRLGDFITTRYQVMVKLGYGSASTAWLCRDNE